MLSRFKTSGSWEDKILYSAQRKEYKHIMKNKKNDHRKSQIGLLLNVANDPQAFWNQIRRHRRKPTVTNSIPEDDWYAHFETFFTLVLKTCLPRIQKMRASRLLLMSFWTLISVKKR